MGPINKPFELPRSKPMNDKVAVEAAEKEIQALLSTPEGAYEIGRFVKSAIEKAYQDGYVDGFRGEFHRLLDKALKHGKAS